MIQMSSVRWHCGVRMKIRIIGPVGSGQTTLANQISVRTELPVMSLGELNWDDWPLETDSG